MLRISKLADYATIVMVYLTQNHQQLHNAKDIAAATHLGHATVSKLLKLLHAAELVASSRGIKGGYSLNADPKQISVAQVIAAVEGDTGLTQCSIHAGDCQLEAVCNIRGNWQMISQAINAALDSLSIADLAKPRMQQHTIDVSAIKRIKHVDANK